MPPKAKPNRFQPGHVFHNKRHKGGSDAADRVADGHAPSSVDLDADAGHGVTRCNFCLSSCTRVPRVVDLPPSASRAGGGDQLSSMDDTNRSIPPSGDVAPTDPGEMPLVLAFRFVRHVSC